MCGPSSDEQVGAIDKESTPTAGGTQMFTTDSVKAEVRYRRERLTRDYGRSARQTGTRRHLVHLFSRNA